MLLSKPSMSNESGDAASDWGRPVPTEKGVPSVRKSRVWRPQALSSGIMCRNERGDE